MRDLRRNQQTIWYAQYEGKQDVIRDGYKTGQQTPVYSAPVQARVSVSLATGRAAEEVFGTAVAYDRVMSTVQALPIDENSRLWIDTAPDAKPDYRVVRVAHGLNQHLYAIKRMVQDEQKSN